MGPIERAQARQRPLGQLDRGALLTAAALIALASAAWAALLIPSIGADAAMPGMAPADPLGAATFVAAWLVMMTAMMLPSAAPMVLLYRAMVTGSAMRRAGQTAVFVSGYLVAWTVFGAVVYAVQQSLVSMRMEWPALDAAWPSALALVLASAGLYQFSPLKDRCLRQCRSPFSFLLLSWRPDVVGGFRLGVRHGIYCAGCCWGLMAVLVAAGAMGLAWVTLIALVVFAEKLLPRNPARLVGLVLLGLAASVAIQPELADRLAG